MARVDEPGDLARDVGTTSGVNFSPRSTFAAIVRARPYR